MIKRTLLFSSACYLSTKNEQLVVQFKEDKPEKTVPIEDIGVVVLEHNQITVSTYLLDALMQSKATVITCNKQHLPSGILMPTVGHSEQSARYKVQLNASEPLKKNLWKQTISAKIENQALGLSLRGFDPKHLLHLANKVKSGDTSNIEAQAAVYYWRNFFNTQSENFIRDYNGDSPNTLLNYGYAIIRATMARALSAAGLLLTTGIFHKNKYNPYCLADDIMEPYRVFIDLQVAEIIDHHDDVQELTPALKQHLLSVLDKDVYFNEHKSVLKNAIQKTANSVYKCMAGEKRKIKYPTPTEIC